MPTIIGNSTIRGIGQVTGPTGPQGPQGPQGPTGPFGITGNTGPTGSYILGITKNILNHIIFELSDSNLIYTNYGFTGPTGAYVGISGATYISPGFISFFNNIVSGKTLQFRGVSAGTNVNVGFNSDRTAVNITLNKPTTNAIYGNTAANYILYSNELYSATSSRIGVTQGILSFGVTATNGATGDYVNVYSSFNEKLYNIGPFPRHDISPALNDVLVGFEVGGCVLNLNKYSSYLLQTPIGITSFVVENNTNAIQAYTFFINGSDVWNFPKNVYFENTDRGIGKYDFLDGINIVHMWTTNGGTTFNASIIERGMVPVKTVDNYSDSIGSCCVSNSSCEDYKTPEECASLGGIFRPLKSCIDTCGVFGSCCINGQCYSDIEANICASFGGQFKTEPCSQNPCPPLERRGACCNAFGYATCQENVLDSECPPGNFYEDTLCSSLSTTCGDATVGICGDPVECIDNDITKAECQALISAGQPLTFYDPVTWPGCVKGTCCSSDATNPAAPTWSCNQTKTKPECIALGAGSSKSSLWYPSTTSCSEAGNCTDRCPNGPASSNCLGACCTETGCREETQSNCENVYFGTWYQGIPCSSDICQNYPYIPLGACCQGNSCSITTENTCLGLSGVWSSNTPCTPINPCIDTAVYDFTLQDSTTNLPIDSIILDIDVSPSYTKTFNIVVSSTSSRQFKLSLPSSFSCNGATFTVTRLTGNNNTLLNNGDIVNVTISTPVNSTLIRQPACTLPGVITNFTGAVVANKNITVYVGGAPSTALGCVTCSTGVNKFKVQLEGTIKRYCLDCQRYDEGTKTYRPYPVKEQKVYANVCLDPASATTCGFGLTLEHATYGQILDVWDCRYSSSTTDNGIANTCAWNCPHIEYGPTFWEGNKRTISGTAGDSCATIGTNCAANPDTTSTTNTNSINLGTIGVTSANFYRNRVLRISSTCTTGAPTKTLTAKGETKTYNCIPTSVTIDPYYNQLEWSPDSYAKIGYYVNTTPNTASFTAIKTRLANLATRLLTIRDTDTQRFALNPIKINTPVTIHSSPNNFPTCTANELASIENTGKNIFNYTTPTGKTTKYLLFVVKKSNITGITYSPFRTDSVNTVTTSTSNGARGCRSNYSLAVTRMVLNGDGTLDINNTKTTNFLSGKTQFPWNGNGNLFYTNIVGSGTNLSCTDCSLQILQGPTPDPVESGYPYPIWDAMLIGEINPATDLDGFGNLIFETVDDYDFKNQDVYCDMSSNLVRYEPFINSYWKYISNKKPKFTSLNNQTGYDYAHKFKSLIFNSVECNPNSKYLTQDNNVDYTGGACYNLDDQYAYTGAFCSNALSKRPLTILSRIYAENPRYKNAKTTHELTYTASDFYNSTTAINETQHTIKHIVCNTTSGCVASSRDCFIETGNVYFSSGSLFSGLTLTKTDSSLNTNSTRTTPNWLNDTTQKYSLHPIAYLTGSNFSGSEIPQSYFLNVPIHAVESVINKTGSKNLTSAITMSPSLVVTPTTTTITVTNITPRVVVPQGFVNTGWDVTVWVVNPNFDDATGTKLNSSNAFASASSNSAPSSWTSSLSITIQINQPGQPSVGWKDIGSSKYFTIVAKFTAKYDEDGVREPDGFTPRTRTFVKILQTDVRIDGGAQTLTDNDDIAVSSNSIKFNLGEVIKQESQGTPSLLLSNVKNKLINNKCVSIDCTYDQLYCDQLKDC